LTEGTGDGLVIYDMARNTRVVQCQTLQCFNFGDSTNTQCLTTYTEPFCATGMTLSFWVRCLRGFANVNQIIGIMSQGTGTHQGLEIVADFKNKEFAISLELPSTHWFCRFQNVPTEFYQNWMFVSYTYDKSTQKLVCFLNERRLEVTTATLTSSRSPSPRALFGSIEKYLLDDVFFVPKFSTDDMISAYYNSTKFN